MATLQRNPGLASAKQLAQHVIGFDELLNTIDKAFSRVQDSTSNFPPKNVIRKSEDEFQIQFAVAGFEREELSVFVENGVALVIEGRKDKSIADFADECYLHRGIAFRDFRHEIRIPENAEITVQLINGLLIIDGAIPKKKEPEPKRIMIQ